MPGASGAATTAGGSPVGRRSTCSRGLQALIAAMAGDEPPVQLRCAQIPILNHAYAHQCLRYQQQKAGDGSFGWLGHGRMTSGPYRDATRRRQSTSQPCRHFAVSAARGGIALRRGHRYRHGAGRRSIAIRCARVSSARTPPRPLGSRRRSTLTHIGRHEQAHPIGHATDDSGCRASTMFPPNSACDGL